MIHTLLCLTILATLALIAYTDHRSSIIPNTYNLILFLLGIISAIAEPDLLSLEERILGIFIISIPCIILNIIYQDGIGGGDIKLLAAAGFCLGWERSLKAALLASILAAAIFTILLKRKKIHKKDKLPFGPYLCIGMAVELLWL